VNSRRRKDSYPIPSPKDELDDLKDSEFISNLDLLSGYHQIRMHPDSKEVTAFIVPGRGLLEFEVMLFGIDNAPAKFQRQMEAKLHSVLGKFCKVYFDDTCMASKTFRDHHLNQVFTLLYDAGFKLNWENLISCVNTRSF